MPCCGALVLLAAAVLGLAGIAPGPASATSRSGPAAGGPRTAVLVYIAWQELEGTVLDPTLLRRATTGFLAESLIAQGYEVVPDEDLALLVTRWRLRNSLMLRDEFLATLRGDLNGDHLLVAQLFLQPGRLLVAWRLTDTATGLLEGVGFCEAGLGSPLTESINELNTGEESAEGKDGTGPWLQAAEQAAASLVVPKQGSGPDSVPPLVVLPIRSVGSDFGSTALATHILMEELVMRRGVALADPGLAVSTLRKSGHDPAGMDPDVRTLLRERFGSRIAVVGQLISYDLIASGPVRPAPVFDGGEGTQSAGPLTDFALSLTKIDLESGLVLASHEMYEDRSVEFGWFGIQYKHSLLERLQTSVAELWTGVGDQLKDGGDVSPH